MNLKRDGISLFYSAFPQSEFGAGDNKISYVSSSCFTYFGMHSELLGYVAHKHMWFWKSPVSTHIFNKGLSRLAYYMFILLRTAMNTKIDLFTTLYIL